MADYISREDAEQFICEECERPGCPKLWGGDCDRIDRLNKIPAADVRPVVRGMWMKQNPGNKLDGNYYCSACQNGIDIADGSITPLDRGLNYCPNCGTDMRGES